ncbi:uncharacterized protein V6R79_021558 [Siganus canaliculatus]
MDVDHQRGYIMSNTPLERSRCISIMSRIVAVTLLLITLADIFCFSTASHAEFHRSKMVTHTCGCRVWQNGKIKCNSRALSNTVRNKYMLVKCLCSKTNQHKFAEIQSACKSWYPGTPLTLL